MGKRTSTDTLMTSCNWLNITELARYYTALAMWNVIRHQAPRNISSKITINQDLTIDTPIPRMQITQSGFRNRGTTQWNQLDFHIRNQRKLTVGLQMDFLPTHPPRGAWVFRWTFSSPYPSPPHHQLFVPTRLKKAQVLFLPGREKLKFLFLGGGAWVFGCVCHLFFLLLLLLLHTTNFGGWVGLYCTVLYCTVLYCIVLYCTVLYCIVLYCTVLYCTVQYHTVLYCTKIPPPFFFKTLCKG